MAGFCSILVDSLHPPLVRSFAAERHPQRPYRKEGVHRRPSPDRRRMSGAPRGFSPRCGRWAPPPDLPSPWRGESKSGQI